MSEPLQAPPQLPSPEAIMARASGENFVVAGLLLGPRRRRRLLSIYGFARLVDELGDSLAGDREQALDWLEAELDRAFAGAAEHPLLVALEPVIAECRLEPGPFRRLIAANRLDQKLSRYADWDQLRHYCTLSADPVGELVLAAFDARTPERVALSDSICTALQVAEHCQDVREDLAQGRIYLPQTDMARCGCSEDDLAAPRAGSRVRAVIAFEVARARGLLDEGMPLVGQLRGRARLAVAAFVAGGRAALDAIERCGYDVLAHEARPDRLTRVRWLRLTLSQARAGAPAGGAR